MLSDIDKITWKQNRMHLSEVLIDVRFRSKKGTKFFLKEDMVNHIFRKRDQKIEIHLNFNQSDRAEVFTLDFSRLKTVKPVYPLLQQKVAGPKIEKKIAEDLEEIKKIGVYSIFNADSAQWMTNKGWGDVQESFDIVPERTIQSNLSVTIAPQKAVESGAAWRIKDMQWQKSASNALVAIGGCEVEFKELPGWISPATEKVHIFEGIDEKLSATYTQNRPKLLRREPSNMLYIFLVVFIIFLGFYFFDKSASPGSLAVALSPPQAATQGARWRIENGDWRQSGEVVELEAGQYTVEFKPLDGWQHPSNQTISLEKGEILKSDETYQKMLSVRIMPQEAAQSGAKWKIKGESKWRDSNDSLPLDQKSDGRIIFKDIEGWTSPVEKNLANLKSDVTAEYVKEPSSMTATNATQVTEKREDRKITVRINPSEAVEAGARWKLKGPGEWKASGEEISGLINIPYTVIFKRIEGWKTPQGIKLAVRSQVEVVKQGEYQKILENTRAEVK